MNDPVKSETPAAKRGLDRDSLLLKAILRFPRTKDEGEVRIRNLSAGGLMAEAPLRVARGELVEINLRSIGWISGHVAWVTEGRLGIAFDHPINPKDARKPVGTTDHEMPLYLKKLNNVVPPSKLRRI
jgi:PilZ domain